MNRGSHLNRPALVGVLVLLCTAVPAAQGQAPAERGAALKQSLQARHERLLKYEWIETTAVSLKGEEKSRKASAGESVSHQGRNQ